MPGVLCEHCTGYCCRYIALPIDTPTERSEIDFVRWYLLHEGVSVFIEDGDWYITFQANCRRLLPDNRCGIYATRPKICRDYTTDNCDYHSGDYGWEHHFTCPEHLDDYVAAHFVEKKPARGKKRRKGVRARLGARAPKRHRLTDYAAASTDLRGTPLPILGVQG